jgi:hypothetical protein
LANGASSLRDSTDSLDESVPISLTGTTADTFGPPARKKGGIKELWAAWKRIARKIGDFQARVLLTIFYFVLLAPFALIVRRTSDPLAMKTGAQRGWNIRQNAPDYSLEAVRKQF